MNHEERARELGHRSDDPPPSRVANYFLLGVGIVTVLLYGGLALLRFLLAGAWPWK